MSLLMNLKQRGAALVGAAALIASLGAATGAQAQSAVTLHFTWYNDGQEGQIMRGLLDKFEAANPNIKVALDVVAFKDLHTTLSAQVSAGQGPDLARETAPQLYYGNLLDLTPYLKDATAFKAAYPAADFDVLAGPQPGLNGYPLDTTSSGMFVNVSLFKKAGVAIPSDGNDKATWEQWVDAATKVRDAAGVPYAVAIDRSGHRWFSMVLSYGGHIVGPDGKFTIDTPGFRQAAAQLLSWHTNNLIPLEVWAGSGSGYAAAADYFINQQIPVYYAGSWQVSNFDKVIGTKFDWKAVPTPCETICSAMPGGTFVLAFKSSQHPKEVGQLVDYLTSPDVASQYAVNAPALPARLDLAKQGLKYPSRSDDLNVFLKNIAVMPNEAFALQNNALINQVNFESRDRLSQVIVGEIDLNTAIKDIQQKMDTLQAQGPSTPAATKAATAAATAAK
jgi:alpha-1,4-digalacturonate transport system substrate-binding protein